MFDLSAFDTRSAADEGVVLELLHPKTGAVLYYEEGKPVTLTLAGRDSVRATSALREVADRRLRAAQRKGASIFSSEQYDSEELEVLSACTIAWAGVVVDGKELECTAENARAFYNRFPDFKDQAQRFVDDRGNFLRRSPGS